MRLSGLIFTLSFCLSLIILPGCFDSDGDDNRSGNGVTYSITIESPVSNATVNGITALTGIIEGYETAGIRAIYISYFAYMTDSTMEASYNTENDLDADTAAVPTLDKWIKLASPGAEWSHDFDTTVITGTTCTGYMIYAAVVNEAGEVYYTKTSVNIDQESDLPVSYITSPSQGDQIAPSSYVRGTVSDDDGLEYIYWRIAKTSHGAPSADYSTWGTTDTSDCRSGVVDLTATSPTEFAFELLSPTGTGEYAIHIQAIDINAVEQASFTTITWDQAPEPPSVVITSPSQGTLHTNVIIVECNAVDTGIYNITSISLRAESSLGSIEIVLNAPADFTAAAHVTETILIGLNTIISATVSEVTITAESTNDNNMTSSPDSVTITCDNTAPDISIINPSSGLICSGITAMNGAVSDNCENVKAIYISYFAGMDDATMEATYTSEANLDADTTASPTMNKWVKLSTPGAEWSHDFDSYVITGTTCNDYMIYVAAVDEIGNVSYTKVSVDINQ